MSLGPTSSRIPGEPAVYRELLQLYRPIGQCTLEDKERVFSRLPQEVVRTLFDQVSLFAGRSPNDSISSAFVLSSDDHLRKAIHHVACRAFETLSLSQADEVRDRIGRGIINSQAREGLFFLEQHTETVLSGLADYFAAEQGKLRASEVPHLEAAVEQKEPQAAEFSDKAVKAAKRLAQVLLSESRGDSPPGGLSCKFSLSIPLELSCFAGGLKLLIEVCENDQVFKAFIVRFLDEDAQSSSPLVDKATSNIFKEIIQTETKSEDLKAFRSVFPSYLWTLAFHDMLKGNQKRGCSLIIQSLSFLQSREKISANWLAPAIEFFQCGEPNLLRKLPVELGLSRSASPLKADQALNRYQEGLSRYAHLSMIVGFFFVASRAPSFFTSKLLPAQQTGPFFGMLQNLIVAEINELKVSGFPLPISIKTLLMSVCQRAIERLLLERKTFECFLLIQRFASSSIAMHYLDTFLRQPNQLKWGESNEDLKNPHQISKGLSSFLDYSLQHKEDYEGYLPWLLELLKSIELSVNRSERDLFCVKNVLNFLQYGDVFKLIVSLRDAKGNLDEMDMVFYRAVKEFSEAEQAGERKMHKHHEQLQNRLSSLEHIFVITPRIIGSLLHRYIEDSERSDPDAIYLGAEPFRSLREQDKKMLQSEKAKAKRKKKRAAHSEAKKQPEVPLSSSSRSSSSKIKEPIAVPSDSVEKSSSSSCNVQPVSTPPVFVQQLQNYRSLVKQWAGYLKTQRANSTGVALEDAYRHFDNLLCSLRRLHNQASRGEVTAGALFSFSHDCVRDCTLGVEQLLSALYRENNLMVGNGREPPELTHDLTYIMRQCVGLPKEFSHDMWRWIREINRGEIVIRDLRLLTQEDTALQNLLRRGQELIGGPIPSQANVGAFFKALHAYLNPLGKLLQSVQSQFPAKQNQVKMEHMESEFLQLLDEFCQEMSLAIDLRRSDEESIQAVDGALISLLIDLRSSLKKAIEKDSGAASFGGLDNVISNLLVNLQAEICFHGELEPIETSLHLKNTLLLNQCIAEAVLLFKLREKGISISSEEQYRHDLLLLVDKLSIKERFTQEEIEFLHMGKSSRQLIRYPAAYANEQSKKSGPSRRSRLQDMESLIGSSDRLAATQSADLDLQGFVPGKRSDEAQYRKIKEFVLKDLQLLASIVDKILQA